MRQALLLASLLLWGVGACSPQPAPTQPPELRIVSAESVLPTQASTATAAQSPPTPTAPAATLEASIRCAEEDTICMLDWDFPLDTPVRPPARTTVDATYRFGSTQFGNLVPHHGVEFVNAAGTPVYAAADGEVVFAGWDDGTTISPWADFYGNVVVIQHAGLGKLFSVYAHLADFAVGAGDAVLSGDRIGSVGATGGALGSHLHFEVRLGGWSYTDSLNPELWLHPKENGVLAIQLTDAAGQMVRPDELRVQWFKERSQPFIQAFSLEPYNVHEKYPVRHHPLLKEIAALGGLPANGVYRLTFNWQGRLYVVEDIGVEPGRLTLVKIIVD